MTRERLQRRVDGGGNYFATPNASVDFIKTGCKMLDLALGGGWAENRIANIVGDKSSGKTLLCIEAAANFARKYDNGKIIYRECEAAFDPEYAAALGMPVDRVDFGEPIETVEDLFEDLERVVSKAKRPTLYFVDSLDALSDRAEVERDISQGSFGAEKAKKMSQLFRRLVRKMERSNVTLIIVSQVRDKIGIAFGDKTTRSGGRALDFYASQVLSLAQISTIKRTVSGQSRPVGIQVRAKVKKNKVALPYREVEFQLTFGYGVDDVLACVQFLRDTKSLDDIGISESRVKRYVVDVTALEGTAYRKEVKKLHRAVSDKWYSIERSFLPTRSKYAD